MKLKILLLAVVSLFIVACSAGEESTEDGVSQNVDSNEVEEESNKGIVTIQDKTFDDDELEFYTLMNHLNILLQMNITEDEKDIAYLEEQLVYFENINVNLQSMIELYAMSLLGEEKNYFIPDDKLRKAVKSFNEKIEESEQASKAIEDFGKEKYNRNVEAYFRQSMLRDRIAGELEEKLKEENKDASNREINYLLEKEFEDLYADQLASLEMEIHLK